MKRALIIEDDTSDLQRAAEVLRKLGIEDIDAVSRVDTALLRLEQALEAGTPFPDLIVLDLGFNVESGFEILRFWKSNKSLNSRTRIVVWTRMSDLEQELAGCFGAEVVPKSSGAADLESAVRRCIAAQAA